jgi:AcrR family transcriptional regulator
MVEQKNPGTRRRYRMGRRQEALDETRQRIAAAAFELHGEIGPSRTTISAIAERAGVQRHTVYNHFPDLESLFRACTAHGMSVMGIPEAEPWRTIPDPVERLRYGLNALYRVYRTNARPLGTILRDLPVFADVGGDEEFTDRMSELFETLADGWPEDDPQQAVRTSAIGHAMRFETWQSLTDGGLTDDQARDLMVQLVVGAGA